MAGMICAKRVNYVNFLKTKIIGYNKPNIFAYIRVNFSIWHILNLSRVLFFVMAKYTL